MGERGAQSEAERQQSRQSFCTAFLHAVDTDGDGGLSLCELKAAELGCENPWFVKASLWLTTNGNKKCKEYDVRGIGIIDEPDLREAMDLFCEEHWKYEGANNVVMLTTAEKSLTPCVASRGALGSV